MDVRALSEPRLLPQTAAPGADGRLALGGLAIADLVAEHGTPAMLFDEAHLRARAREYLRAFRSRHADTDVYFASKALGVPAIAGLMAQEGLGCDVVTSGELKLALAGGMPAERILLHGNAKTDADLRTALDAGVGLVVIDSLDEIERLARILDRPQTVLLRINPGVAAPTHEAMATGHDGSKFGIPLEQVDAALERIAALPLLELEGLHTHIGSQILELAPFEQQVAELARRRGFATYDLGGGLGVRYTPEDPEPPSIDAYAERLVAAAHRHLGTDVRLIVEPGRSLVASAGMTVYRVISVKRAGAHTFVAVDGGMGDNLEPQLYGQRFAPTLLDVPATRPLVPCQVVGHHCETGDRLVGETLLPDPQPDDLLLLPVTGAYCYAMANNYNAVGRPPLLLVGEGRARTIVRRETFADLLARTDAAA